MLRSESVPFRLKLLLPKNGKLRRTVFKFVAQPTIFLCSACTEPASCIMSKIRREVEARTLNKKKPKDYDPEDEPIGDASDSTSGSDADATFASGYLFFLQGDTLMAQPFDSKNLRLAGEPVPVVQQIGTGGAHAHFSATSGGVQSKPCIFGAK